MDARATCPVVGLYSQVLQNCHGYFEWPEGLQSQVVRCDVEMGRKSVKERVGSQRPDTCCPSRYRNSRSQKIGRGAN